MKNSKPLLAFLVVALLGAAIFIFLSRQTEPSLAGQIADGIETAVSTNATQINLADLTDFAWDNLYIFAPYTTPEQINAALGFTWPEAASADITLHDDITLLIFVQNGRIVDHVEFPRAQGDFAAAAAAQPYTPERAIFDIAGTNGIQLMPTTLGR
jgi:hypothetical protein